MIKKLHKTKQNKTFREQTKIELEESLNYAQSVIDNVYDPLLILDSNLKVRSANNAFYSTFKTNADSCVGKYIYDIKHHLLNDNELKKHLEDILPQRTFFSEYEMKLNIKNEPKIFLLNGKEIYRKGPHIDKLILLSFRDITKRKIAEEELISLNRQLTRSNKELEEFASVASHDLQEPLRKIQAFSDRLVLKYGNTFDPEAQDYIQRMQRAAERMHKLINDLLSYSRVTTKAQPFTDVNLEEIVRDVISDLEITIENNNAKVILEELPVIKADPTQMRQLFQNLISNALKFKQTSTYPVVKISAKKIEEDKYEINVEDNGIGFEEKYLEKIFGIFQRLHTASEYPGSGIGLAVCKKIVDRHGGNITARSYINQGSKFIIDLPINTTQQI